ncbi:M23 family metallopeptidase [Paenarthrobacter sp. YJN-5]|uniref:M23 family metallopeptidase n=1 Tax=Paenarthrobacter sp. YJN-5 TaxID=2735316 RepID=UPI001D0CAD14|nr:M23 family metallopeptidase [Paenarthrobacter sp. YJN-5]
MGYLFPFPRAVKRSQDFGANPGWGPNPPGGHNGDDWAVPVGTPVRAAGDGEVVFAGQFDDTYADNFGWNLMYGGLMVVLNMNGATAPYFEYGHNSELRVKTGQRVKRGQIIALSGNTDGGTNVSTGPHCHVGCLPFNFNLNTNTYGRVNPRLFMTDYWEDEANGSASLGPAGDIKETTTDPQETEVSDAVDRIIAEIRNIAAPGESGKRNAGPLYDLVQNVETINAALLPGEAGVRHAGAVYAALAALDPAQIAAAVTAAVPAETAKQVAALLGGK